jgi:hypothetical protein
MQIKRTVTFAVTNHILKTCALMVLRGQMIPAGTLVEVSQNEAADMLRRCKAVAATEAEIASAPTIIHSRTIDGEPHPGAWRAAFAWSH